MQMLGNITTKLAAHEVRMDDLTSYVIVPGVATEVSLALVMKLPRRNVPWLPLKMTRTCSMAWRSMNNRITEHLRGDPQAYLTTSDDDSGADDATLAQLAN